MLQPGRAWNTRTPRGPIPISASMGRASSGASPARDRRAQRGLVEQDGWFERGAVQRQPDLAQGALHDVPVTAGRQGGIDERTDIGAPSERAVVNRHVAGDRADEDLALAIAAVGLLERGRGARPVEAREVGRAHAHARQHAALVAQVPGDERGSRQRERQGEPDEERDEQAPHHACPAAVDRLTDRRLECRLLDVADGGHGPPPPGPLFDDCDGSIGPPSTRLRPVSRPATPWCFRSTGDARPGRAASR